MNRSLIFWALASMGVYQTLLVVNLWGQWTLLALVGVAGAVRAGLNMGVAPRLEHRLGARPSAWLVMSYNLLLSLGLSVLLRWSLLAWCNVLFQAMFLNGFRERDGDAPRQRIGLGVFLGLSAGLAAHEGIAPQTIGVFCTMAWMLYFIGEVRCRMLVQALDASRESHKQLQRMQAQLVAQEKLSSLGLLAAGVAHEINNPMAFVTSNIHLLSRELEGLGARPELLREYVDDVLPATLEGIRRVNAIVADLRRFARDEPETPAAFDLNLEVSTALRLSQGALKGHCDVRVQLAECPPLRGQARQIGQVLVNLVVNAAQAVPARGGVVEVSTHATGTEVLVRVRDNGVGMSAEVRDKLFQPFFTTKPVGQGTGLGLAVAYGIITGHGGRIDVESEPGRGTCFTVRLPCLAVPVPLEPSPATPGPRGLKGLVPA